MPNKPTPKKKERGYVESKKKGQAPAPAPAKSPEDKKKKINRKAPIKIKKP